MVIRSQNASSCFVFGLDQQQAVHYKLYSRLWSTFSEVRIVTAVRKVISNAVLYPERYKYD